jgi:hypothetical protein
MIKLLLASVTLSLIGCAAPFTAASVGVWSTTGKSTTDHVMSLATDKDCISTRIFTDDKVCQNSIDRQERAFADRKR